MSESIRKSKENNDGLITDLVDQWTPKMSTEPAVAVDDYLLVDWIKYWNFVIREYTIYCKVLLLYIICTIYCKVSFLTGQIQNALPSSYCEYARNVGRCMYWQTIHELLCLLSASSLPRDTFTKRSLLWCSSFRVSRNINIANATTSSPHTIQVQKVKTPS